MAFSLLTRTVRPSRPTGTDIPTDAQLLERFVATRDDAAFAALVRRHGPMVLRLCRLQLGQTADAEDAFQAVFIVLARKAGELAQREALASWLFGVTRRVARRAREQVCRRRLREQSIEQIGGVPGPDSRSANDLRPVLDEEVHRLPAEYRAPIMLCCLEGKTYDQTAQLLGCPLGTLKVRLMRARDLLRQRLARRGMMLSATAIGVALEPGAAEAAASFGLTACTTESAVVVAAGQVPRTELLSPAAKALADGAVQGAAAGKLKTGGIAVAVAVVTVLLLFPRGPAPWELSTTLPPHKGKITGLDLSADGRLLASISDREDLVRLRDLASGAERAFPIAPGEIRSVFLSPDGRTLVIENPPQNHFKVLDATTGRERATIPLGRYRCHGGRFWSDGRKFAVLHEAPANRVAVQLWDVASGRLERTLQGPPVAADGVSLARSGRWMVVSSLAWATKPGCVGVRLWDVANEREAGVLCQNSPGLGFTTLSPDGKTLAVTEKDTHLGESSNIYTAHGWFPANGNRGIVVRLWDVPKGGLRATLHFGTAEDRDAGTFMTGIGFTADSRTVAVRGTLGGRGAIRFFDAGNGKVISSIDRGLAEKNGVTLVEFSPDGKRMVVAEHSGSLTVWKQSR